MECPECGFELVYWDFFGTNMHLDSFDRVKPGFKKSGDIYKCPNPECETIWHTHVDNDDDLHEGMPC